MNATLYQLLQALELQSGNVKLLHECVKALSARVGLLEAILTSRYDAAANEPTFSEIADGHQREIAAKDLRLTDEQIDEIEAEIQSNNTEEECQ